MWERIAINFEVFHFCESARSLKMGRVKVIMRKSILPRQKSSQRKSSECRL